jgi:hypothetical protein
MATKGGISKRVCALLQEGHLLCPARGSAVLTSTTKGPKGQMRPAANNIYVLHTSTTKPATFLLVLLLGPSMPPVYSTSCWKAKLQSLELSNLSCSHCNLVVHIPTQLASETGEPGTTTDRRQGAHVAAKGRRHCGHMGVSKALYTAASASLPRCAY